MLFTDPFFIFGFFPAVFILQFLIPQNRNYFRNFLLFAFSIIFYFYGEKFLVLFLLLSILINYALGRTLHRPHEKGSHGRISATSVLILAIIFNLGLLAYFKYANFFVIEILSVDTAYWENIALPIGISFYTFQCLSYIIDIYRKDITPTTSVIDFGAYVSCFPQLIAGPIVRYSEIAPALRERRITFDDVYEGVCRFIIGFGKKMLIANPMGWVADQVYAMPTACIDIPHAWLAIICYTLQIYYDFSGYSDMAIGLGRLLGFRFPENFNFPYIAASIRDFWHRWHMTLTRWFRDYLYIPLGGSHASAPRVALNKWVVFLLCGFWHGASWNFLAWGAWHGFFLVTEGALAKRCRIRPPLALRHAYTLLVVALGWVIFRAATLDQALTIGKAAFGLTAPEEWVYTIWRLLRPDTILILLLGAVGSSPIWPLVRRLLARRMPEWLLNACTHAGLLCIFVAALAASVSTAFNPFLYFRF